MQEQPELVPGQWLEGSPFRVVRFVRAGGMGAVYEVEHARLGKRYIAKTLRARLRSRQDLIARMELEAKTLARISHPNIVQVHHLDVTPGGIPYFIMEMLHGIDLRRLLATRRRLDVDTALGIMFDVLEALGTAHHAGVIHRDVKPENIFLARSGVETVTKLLDFGITRVLSGDKNLTGARFVGTIHYAAPEQLLGGVLSEQTDVYAAGCVLFEILAGQRPFADETELTRIGEAHIYRPAPPLTRFVDVPEELARIVGSALEKEPARRPASALAFASQLYALRDRARAAASPVSTTTTEEMLRTALGGFANTDAQHVSSSSVDAPTLTAARMSVVPLAGGTLVDAFAPVPTNSVSEEWIRVDDGDRATRTADPQDPWVATEILPPPPGPLGIGLGAGTFEPSMSGVRATHASLAQREGARARALVPYVVAGAVFGLFCAVASLWVDALATAGSAPVRAERASSSAS